MGRVVDRGADEQRLRPAPGGNLNATAPLAARQAAIFVGLTWGQTLLIALVSLWSF
jgi:hypothetical protein